MLRLIALALALILLACWQPGCGHDIGETLDSDPESDPSDELDTSGMSDPSDIDSNTSGEIDLVTPPGCEGVLNFSDANLELAVRGAIDMPQGDIYYADVLELKALSVMPPGTS